jgi:Zinc binding domain
MSSCCCPGTSVEPSTARCPQSGASGNAIDRQTIKALLTERALGRLCSGEYRFCPDADCDVVYFDGNGSLFATNDLRVAVWQKLPFGTRPVCYCFGESEASIRAEIAASGRSAAVERIREHIAAGRCACEVRNPRGACCLGDVTAAVRRVEAALAIAEAASAGADAGAADGR